jgi:hypothetical protein
MQRHRPSFFPITLITLVCLLGTPLRAAQAGQSGGAWDIANCPVSDDLYSVAAVSATDAWIVGSKGQAPNGVPYGSTILRWDGANWNIAGDYYDPYELRSIAMRSADDGWAAGGNWVTGSASMILRWNGSSWAKTTGLAGYLRSVSPVSATEVWAVGPYQSSGFPPSQGSVRTRWTGSGWNQTIVMDRKGLMSLDMLSPGEGWAVGWNGSIARRHGNAWSWESSPVTNTTLYAVDMRSADDGWAVGGNGIILHWDGAAWARVDSPVTQTLHAVAAAAADDGWAVGGNGTILHWDGTAWSRAASPVTRTLNGVVMLSPNEGWAVGNAGTILHFTRTSNAYLPLVER